MQNKTTAVYSKEIKQESYGEMRQRILHELSLTMILPDKEMPDILIVNEDFFKLQKYPVFTKAKKGDFLIMYPKYHKKMIIFDEKQKKIIDIISLNYQNQSDTIFGDLGKK